MIPPLSSSYIVYDAILVLEAPVVCLDLSRGWGNGSL